jgi:hypothetical protein
MGKHGCVGPCALHGIEKGPFFPREPGWFTSIIYKVEPQFFCLWPLRTSAPRATQMSNKPAASPTRHATALHGDGFPRTDDHIHPVSHCTWYQTEMGLGGISIEQGASTLHRELRRV